MDVGSMSGGVESSMSPKSNETMSSDANYDDVHSIVFLCSGLEHGRDGVGDYCRCLASELSARGIKCHLLALNDRYVETVVETSLSQNHIPVVRLPHLMRRRDRLKAASHYLAQWAPDWVSLQFVCYGFNGKGIVLPELWWLPRLLARRRLALTLHEVWIGIDAHPPIRDKLVGILQRLALVELIRRLKPAIIHTTNEFYRAVLAKAGITAGILPLFSHIPVTDKRADWLYPAMAASGAHSAASPGSDSWLFGIFGGISPDWPAVLLFRELVAIGQKHRRRIAVISIGNAGGGTSLLARCKALFPQIDFIILGPCDEEKISEFFNSIDFGITTHSLHMLGKSSSIMAMLEHGLPVLCNWGNALPDTKPIHAPFDRQIWQPGPDLEQKLLSPPKRVRHQNMARTIAEQYLASLAAATRKTS
jgi:hypothetical protein